MNKLCAFLAVVFFIVTCWLKLRNSSLADESEWLSEENRRLHDENSSLKDAAISSLIADKSSHYVRTQSGLSIDEDGVPLDNRWKL